MKKDQTSVILSSKDASGAGNRRRHRPQKDAAGSQSRPEPLDLLGGPVTCRPQPLRRSSSSPSVKLPDLRRSSQFLQRFWGRVEAAARHCPTWAPPETTPKALKHDGKASATLRRRY